MSIQLKLGGHSFCADGLPEAAAAEEFVCELLSVKTLLVPREAFRQEAAEMLLAAAGIACNADECAVWSDPEGEAVAVMACHRNEAQALQCRYGDALRFTSPLLFRPQCASRSVWLCRRDDLLYIKVYHEGLRFADVTFARSDADLIYCIDRLGRVFPLDDFELCPAGQAASATGRLLGRYFKRVRR